MNGYNIAIIGQSGVGKSSLINYWFGEEVAKTGSGAPVTEPGFHKHKLEKNSSKYTLYDSFGIEPGPKTIQWINDFKAFIGPKQQSADISEWLHTVIFCISGASSRLQDFELDIIRTLQKKELNPIIALTHYDAKDAKELQKTIHTETGIFSLPIINVDKKNFTQTITRSGIEELEEQAKLHATKNIKNRSKLIVKRKQIDLIKIRYINIYNQFENELESNRNLMGNISEENHKKLAKKYLKLINDCDAEIDKILKDELAKVNHYYRINIAPPIFNSNTKTQKLKSKDTEINLIEFIFSPINYAIDFIISRWGVDKNEILGNFKKFILRKVNNDLELSKFFNSTFQ